jgi:hypothetical protein
VTTASVAPLPLTLGQQLHLAGDPRSWTVRSVSEHFAALTRPVADQDWAALPEEHYFLEGEVLYTVLDWRNGVRGPCNLSGQGWGHGTYSEAECAAMLAEFESGELEVSHRNQVRIEFGAVQ